MRRGLPLVVVCAFALLPTHVCAGLYHPDTLGAFDIDDDGNAVAVSPDSFFVMLNIVKEADWNNRRLSEEYARQWLEFAGITRRTERPKPDRYLELLEAIDRRRKKGVAKLTPDELVAQCADLLRLRADDKAIDEALGILSSQARRPPEKYEFFILALYSYALALKGETTSAYENADSAIRDYSFPERIRLLDSNQLAWYRRFERDYHVPLLRYRKEIRPRELRGEMFGLDPLFPAAGKGKRELIRYVGDSGRFEPGTISEKEKAKLPPDALAIMQQLVLWYPGDDRLMWQLAELYSALGDVRTAARLFELCVLELKPKNPELRAHRTAIRPAAEKQAELDAIAKAESQRMLEEKRKAEEDRKKAEEEAKEREKHEKKQRQILVGVILGLVLLVLIYWQSREVMRRMRRRSARPTHVE